MNLPSVSCPFCQHPITRVYDVRPNRWDEDHATVRRRRICQACHKRFTTIGPSVPLTQEKVLSDIDQHNI